MVAFRETKCLFTYRKAYLQTNAVHAPQGHEDESECVSKHREEQPICKYVDVCVQMYRIIPISPLDGTTKVERCEGMCKCKL